MVVVISYACCHTLRLLLILMFPLVMIDVVVVVVLAQLPRDWACPTARSTRSWARTRSWSVLFRRLHTRTCIGTKMACVSATAKSTRSLCGRSAGTHATWRPWCAHSPWTTMDSIPVWPQTTLAPLRTQWIFTVGPGYRWLQILLLMLNHQCSRRRIDQIYLLKSLQGYW